MNIDVCYVNDSGLKIKHYAFGHSIRILQNCFRNNDASTWQNK